MCHLCTHTKAGIYMYIVCPSLQDVALATLRKEINFCQKMKLKIIGLVENMSGFQCPCCQVSGCGFLLKEWVWLSVGQQDSIM